MNLSKLKKPELLKIVEAVVDYTEYMNEESDRAESFYNPLGEKEAIAIELYRKTANTFRSIVEDNMPSDV